MSSSSNPDEGGLKKSPEPQFCNEGTTPFQEEHFARALIEEQLEMSRRGLDFFGDFKQSS